MDFVNVSATSNALDDDSLVTPAPSSGTLR
jgi:hypothetical protein